jgi:hypothetical protein
MGIGDPMQPNDFGPIPRHLKLLILVGLLFAAILSTGLFIYFLFYLDRSDIATVVFGAAQAAITGLLIVILFTFSLRMRSTSDVQGIVDRFFAEDILSALSEVSGPPRQFIKYENAEKFLKTAGTAAQGAEVFTNFEKGGESADIRIKRPGKADLDMYVKVNIRHITVKYFFDPMKFSPANDDEDFRKAFSQTLAGAASVGYSYVIGRRFHASKARDVLEVTLYMSVQSDTIINPAEKLFIRHDLKTMTNSFLHSLDGVFR